MTTQIAVRLSDTVVQELDSLVAQGAAPSRTSIIEQALRRELRRILAERDLRILADSGDDRALADFTKSALEHFDLDD